MTETPIYIDMYSIIGIHVIIKTLNSEINKIKSLLKNKTREEVIEVSHRLISILKNTDSKKVCNDGKEWQKYSSKLITLTICNCTIYNDTIPTVKYESFNQEDKEKLDKFSMKLIK